MLGVGGICAEVSSMCTSFCGFLLEVRSIYRLDSYPTVEGAAIVLRNRTLCTIGAAWARAMRSTRSLILFVSLIGVQTAFGMLAVSSRNRMV